MLLMQVSVFREGWFQDSLLGKTEIPFLDIEEWSGTGLPVGASSWDFRMGYSYGGFQMVQRAKE